MLLALWDFLLIALVAFPLLTGGVWIRRPGLFLELSDLAAPVLIVAFAGLALSWGFSVPLSESFVSRRLRALWTGWQKQLERSPALLWLLALLMGALWFFSSLRRHWALESHAFDVGIFTNAIWNLVHGNGYVSAPKGGINLFADHQSPIFWLLAPLFRLAPHPETLFAVQSFGLALGGVALFFLAAQYLGRRHWLAAALPLIYWSYLPLRNANAFEFHPETLMLPLFLWGIVGVQSRAARARIAGVIALLVALSAKESAGPVAVGVGLSWLLGAAPLESRSFSRKVGGALILSGLGLFYLDVACVPRWVGRGYAYQNLYSQYGESIRDILLAPVSKPALFWSQLLGPARAKYLLWALMPLGFLPLANPRAFVAALPGFAMLFLSQGEHRISTQYHYIIEPAVGLFWAMPGAIRMLEAQWNLRWGRKLPLWAWALFWALAGSGRSEPFRIRMNEPTAQARWFVSELAPCLDPNLPMAASDAFVPHLATRPWIHGLDELEMGPSEEPEGPVSCIVWDDSVSNWPMENEQVQAVLPEAAAQDFEEVYHCGHTRVLQRGQESCLACKPACRQ